MSFVKDCIDNSMDLWEKCLESEFLTEMQQGSLSEDCFKGYIIDDSLYLREYAKVFAWGMTKAEDWSAIKTYYSLLAFVNEGEGATRIKYLERYGLSDTDIQHLPQRPQSLAYTKCMVEAAKNGEGAPECIMACLPCMISYAWIFRSIVKNNPEVLKSVYGPLIADYASESYAEACRSWADYANSVCENLTDHHKAHCMKIFRDCSMHELHFWEMSSQPREDI